MFQLEKAIDQWKQDCASGEAVSAGHVVELEAHLRDSMEKLAASGLDAEEAFLVGTHRLGAPAKMHHEYGKVHQNHVWLSRIILMLSGYLIVSLLLKFIALDQATAGLIGQVLGWDTAGSTLFFGIPHHWSALVNALVGLAGVGLMVWFIVSLAKGPGHSFLNGDPEKERSLFDALARAPEKLGKLVLWWIALYVLLGLGQVALNVVTLKRVTATQYGSYMASLNFYHQVGHLLTVAVLVVATAVLCKRYRKVAAR